MRKLLRHQKRCPPCLRFPRRKKRRAEMLRKRRLLRQSKRHHQNRRRRIAKPRSRLPRRKRRRKRQQKRRRRRRRHQLPSEALSYERVRSRSIKARGVGLAERTRASLLSLTAFHSDQWHMKPAACRGFRMRQGARPRAAEGQAVCMSADSFIVFSSIATFAQNSLGQVISVCWRCVLEVNRIAARCSALHLVFSQQSSELAGLTVTTARHLSRAS